MTKTQVIQTLIANLSDKIDEIDKELAGIQTAKTKETKSSAGDKYETSREMIRFEEEKANSQISKLKQQLHQVNQINLATKYSTVQFGSLVYTDGAIFLLAVPYGKLIFEDNEIFAISMASPIGQTILNMKVGDNFKMNNNTLEIKEIY